MKPEALAKWEKARAKGKAHYILVSGVLSYGLPMFIAMTFFAHRNDLGPKFIGISAMMWTVGGALFGTVMWHLLERQYRKAMQRNVA
ncbi:hypothetical protein ACFPOA_12295 [Lysobacter niabensis]|uniref:hypothetical protein n=1 Tax=Agrilutibacter niabensis TaxID=380628 RepID=UPI00360D8374